MLAVASTTRVYLYMQAVDMRRSYDGLHAIVQAEYARDIRLGDCFMFINRRRDRIKIIWWDRDGLAIFMKCFGVWKYSEADHQWQRQESGDRSREALDVAYWYRCIQHQSS